MPDLRFALRSLTSAKFATIAAILSLSLGIAGTATFFILLNALFLRTLPASHPEQLFTLATGDGDFAYVRYPVFDYLTRNNTLPRAFAFNSNRVDSSTTSEKKYVEGLFVSGTAFDVLLMQPRLGRFLTPDDSASEVVVLAYHYWQSQFGGAEDVLGKSITLAKRSHIVVGVAPRPFTGLSVGTRPDVILPLPTQNKNGYVAVLGRLGDKESLAVISEKLRSIQPSVREATNPYTVSPYREDYLKEPFSAHTGSTGISPFRQRYGRAMAITMAAVAAVLLLACGTVNTLLLARTLQRQQEFAIRLALGASNWRLIREQISVGAVLAFISTIAGLGLSAFAAPAVLSGLSTQAFTLSLDLAPDIRAIALGTLLAFSTIVLISGASAWYATKAQKLISARYAPEPFIAGLQIANIGVGLQVAFSIALVTVSWLLIATLVNVRSIPLGFDPSRTLLVLTDYAGTPDGKGQRDLIAAVEPRLRALPDVEAVAISSTTPIGNAALTPWVELPDGSKLPQGMQGVLEHQVTSEWLKSLGSSVIAGRDFVEQDRFGTPLVALVNETFDRTFGGGTSFLGKVLSARGSPNVAPRQLTVVGIIKDAPYVRIKDAAPPTIYTLLVQNPAPVQMPPLQIVVRAKHALPMSMVREVSAELQAAAPSVGFSFRTLEDQVGTQFAQERVVGSVAFFFGLFAVLLALLGVFSVMHATVANKHFEIAVRLAIGAGGSQVVRGVFRDILRVVGIATVAGIILSVVSGTMISSVLFGIQPNTPSVFVGSVVIMLLTVAAGGVVPTITSLRTDPSELLRRAQ